MYFYDRGSHSASVSFTRVRKHRWIGIASDLLGIRIVPVSIIEDGAGFLLSFLPLLFIPAMTGVINYPSLISFNGLMLLITVVLSTIVTIIAAGFASQLLEKKQKREEKEKCSKHVSRSL